MAFKKNKATRVIGLSLKWIILLYQSTLSLVWGPRCRFYPSCSRYTQQAIEQHGAVSGLRLGIRRIFRCHPWHPGGVDFPPTILSGENQHE